MGYDIGYPNERKPSITNPPIEQGSTFVLDFTVTNIFTGTPTLTGQYRPTLSGSAHTDMTGTVTVATALLTCRLEIDAATTAAMTAGKGFWDCELTGTVDGDVDYVLKPFGAGNKAIVKGEATK